jgi:Glycosyl transferase family 2
MDHLGMVIVVDDGSTDDTVECLTKARPSSRLKIVRQPALGLVAALNRGLAEATAPLVARMDCDDISLPGRLDAQAAFLASHDHVVAVGAQIAYVNDDGVPDGAVSKYPTSPSAVEAHLFAGGCVLAHPTVAMRRAAVLAVGGYRAGFEAAEDYDLWVRLAEKGQIANLPTILLHYRRHASQTVFTNTLRQCFSRDLAFLCSLERRAGRSDPMASLNLPPPYAPDSREFAEAPAIFRELACGYRAIATFAGGREAATASDLSYLPKLARLNLLGERRRVRRAILKDALRKALSGREWYIAWQILVALARQKLKLPPAIQNG